MVDMICFHLYEVLKQANNLCRKKLKTVVTSRAGWNWGHGLTGKGPEGTSWHVANGPHLNRGLGCAGRVYAFDKTQQMYI